MKAPTVSSVACLMLMAVASIAAAQTTAAPSALPPLAQTAPSVVETVPTPPGTTQTATPPFTPVPCPVRTWEYGDPTLAPLPGARVYAGRYEGGLYNIEVPDKWNGELVLWAHGAVGLGTPQGLHLQVFVPDLRRHWIAAGFAWAASSYRCNGSVFGIGLVDTMALRDVFVSANGGRAPSRVYLTGRSLGGRITILGLRQFPEAFAGGLALCATGQETNDMRVAFRAAAEFITGIQIDETRAGTDLARMQELLGTPPNYTALGRQLASVQLMMTGGARPFAVEGLAQRFLSNVGDGVSFIPAELGRASTNAQTTYAMADGLGLSAVDLNQRARRITADPGLRGPDTPYAELQPFDGVLTRPLMSLQGTGDLQTPVSQQQALKRKAMAAGADRLLVQRLIRSTGHCSFTQQEQARAFDDLVKWVREGKRPDGDDVLGDLRNAGLKFTEPLRAGDPGTVETR